MLVLKLKGKHVQSTNQFARNPSSSTYVVLGTSLHEQGHGLGECWLTAKSADNEELTTLRGMLLAPLT